MSSSDARTFRWRSIAVAGSGVLLLAALAWLVVLPALLPGGRTLPEAPEAQRVRDAQKGVSFQVLTPAYLPPDLDRAGTEIRSTASGPSGEPMVELVYRSRQGGTLFVREWLPSKPSGETLAGSRRIQTRWGEGLLLDGGADLAALWVDVGPVRVATLSVGPSALSGEQIAQIADTFGPTSGRPVYTSLADRRPIRSVPTATPAVVQASAAGVQELTLVVTAGGYSPARFAVERGSRLR